MPVLENFKNIPRSPSHRATGPKCNFSLSKFATKSLEKKKGAFRPPTGDKGACRPPLGRPMGPAHERGRGPVAPPPPPRATGGPVAPPRATGVYPPI